MDMKEERLSILSMLERGIITVDEAEKLLAVLQTGKAYDTEKITEAVNTVVEKAGAAFGVVATKVGAQAEKMQPVVRDMTAKVSEKAEELEPSVRGAAFRMAEMLDDFKGKIRGEEFDEDDFDDDDEWEEWADAQEVIVAAETAPEAAEEAAPEDVEEEIYVKNVEEVLTNLQDQMTQIEDAESFLKSAFGAEEVAEYLAEEEDAE